MQTDSLTQTPDPAPPRPNRRGLVIAAAAFAVVLLVVGVVAFVGGDTPNTQPPATTGEIQDETPSPTAAPATAGVPTTPPPTTSPLPTTEPPPTTAAPNPPPYPHEAGFDVQTIAVIPEGLPGPLAYGSDGILYVGDWADSGRIYRVDLEGTVEVWAESELLVDASAAAFGPDGRLYVSGTGATSEKAIVAVDPDGVVEVVTEDVTRATGVFFTPDGRLLVLDTEPFGAVVEVLGDGSLAVLAQDPVLSEPTHMAFDDDGNLYVVSLNNGRLYLVESSGELTFVERFEGAPVGMVYFEGSLYVSAWGESWIYRYDIASEAVTTVAGNGLVGLLDGPGPEASVNTPDSLALGPNGEIYFVQFATEEGGIAVRVMTRIE